MEENMPEPLNVNMETTFEPIDKPRTSAIQAMRRYIESLPREVGLKEELCCHQFWKSVRTEFLATLLYVLIGCGVCLHYPSVPPQIEPDMEHKLILVEIKTAATFGFTCSTLMYLTSGHIKDYCSCHLNPSLTLSLFLTRELSLFKLVVYLLAQMLASVSASAILFGLSFFLKSGREIGLGLTLPLDGVPPSNVFGFEFLGTFFIVLTYLSTTDSVQRNNPRVSSSPHYLTVGLAVIVSHLFAFRYTGASFNPVRSLGPALVRNEWTSQWLYWVSPLMGGMFAGFTFEYIRSTKRTNLRDNHQPHGEDMRRDFSAVLSCDETDLTTVSAENQVSRY